MNASHHKTSIQAEQLKQLLQANGKTLVSSTVLVLVFAYMQRDVITPNLLFTWFVTMLLVNIFRGVVGRYWATNSQVDAIITAQRLNLFRLGVIVSGFLWGMIGLIVFSPIELQYKMLAIFMLAGLSAGAVFSYSVDRVSALSFTFLVFVPLLVGLFITKGEVFIAMGVSGTLYIIFMMASIQSIHSQLTEKIKLSIEAVAHAEEIKQLAFYDPLTSLPNRRLLLDRMDHALVVSERTARRGAILFLDLDHFKKLNDTLGHDMGDLLLQQVAKRLLDSVRESDTVARLGGDEFVVMLEGLDTHYQVAVSQVELVSQQMLENLNRPYILNTQEYRCTPSIGIAMFNEHGKTHEELLKHADVAMYQSKKMGRNAVQIFHQEMRAQYQ